MPFPIRSPRKIYKIELITKNIDDAQNLIDNLPAGTETSTVTPIYVKMKVAIAEWLGLTPLAYNDPALTGIFAGNGLNNGASFRKRLGGFKTGSYTLIADTFFTVNELLVDVEAGTVTRPLKRVKTMTIGFPVGHSVNEVITFIASTGKLSEIRAIRSPSGAETDVSTVIIN